MKRTWTLLGIGLALALPLTACTRDKAPDVTPTPSPVVTSQPSTMPEIRTLSHLHIFQTILHVLRINPSMSVRHAVRLHGSLHF